MKENNYNLSSKNQRFIAIVIDLQIIGAIRICFDMIVFDTPIQMIIFNWEMLYSFIPCLFLFILKDCVKGQSIGKWFMEIKVSNINGDTPSFWKLVKRNLFLLIPFLEPVSWVFNNDNKRIGDINCNTIVIQNPNNLTFFQKYGIGILLFLVFFIVLALLI